MYDQKYIHLLKMVLTDYHRTYGHPEYKPIRVTTWKLYLLSKFDKFLRRHNISICQMNQVDREKRYNGDDHPAYAETMIGMKRLHNIHECITNVLANKIPGDIIETGVWRGGACIFMRALLSLYGEFDRTVWVCDSFEGLPKPSKGMKDDIKDSLWKNNQLAVSLNEVKYNFAKFGLLSDPVKFVKGWFKDTLPRIPKNQQFAIIRLDGDMYESTMIALQCLYPKLSKGGFCIIDDYRNIKGCKAAVDDYRQMMHIEDEIIRIDQDGIYWQKS